AEARARVVRAARAARQRAAVEPHVRAARPAEIAPVALLAAVLHPVAAGEAAGRVELARARAGERAAIEALARARRRPEVGAVASLGALAHSVAAGRPGLL